MLRRYIRKREGRGESIISLIDHEVKTLEKEEELDADKDWTIAALARHIVCCCGCDRNTAALDVLGFLVWSIAFACIAFCLFFGCVRFAFCFDDFSPHLPSSRGFSANSLCGFLFLLLLLLLLSSPLYRCLLLRWKMMRSPAPGWTPSSAR